MQLRRFLGTFAKAYLAIGAMSVSAFAGADVYPNIHNDYVHDNHGGYHGEFHSDYRGPSSFGSDCHGPSSFGPGCAQSCEQSCCGTPCLPAPTCEWGYNPPAYARCANCDNGCNNGFLDSVSFRADFLWWRLSGEGLDLGVEELVTSTTSPGTPPRTTVTNRARTKRPDFKYDPGFRIGLINHCACDCWDFAVNWTHFRTKASVNGASDAATGVSFFSDWERIVGANPFTARGRYTMNLDLVDLEFGRKFYVSNCFILRPQFGLRFARINQSYRVTSEADGALSGIATNFDAAVKAHSDFLSVGPRVGLDIEVDIGCGLSVFGCAAGSIVFGKFDDHAREIFVDNTTLDATEVGTFSYEAKDSTHRCSRTITDLAFGLKWNRCLEWCNRSHPVSLAFAWEHHGFYNLNHFNFVPRGYDLDGGPNGANFKKHGDLYTQGLTVSLSFGF